MEENKKKKIIITIIGILVLVVALVGATYAWFSSTSKVESKITTAKTELIVSVDEELTHITNIKPTKWKEDIALNSVNSDIVKIPITVNSKSTITINYDLTISTENLKLNEDETLEGGKLSDLKYRLYDSDKKELNDGNFFIPKEQQIILNQNKIEPNEVQNYMLYIYINDTGELQNKLQKLNFNVIINGKSYNPDNNTQTLAQYVLNNYNVQLQKPIFTVNSEDKGLFKGEKEENTLYYFRGPIDNNYVEFGTYKETIMNNVYDYESNSYIDKQVANVGDSILWRIVRINEDNSITLIMENNIGLKIPWRSPGIAFYPDSNLRKVTETWYDNNLKDLDNLIQKTAFCNDKTDNYQAVEKRLNNSTPSPTLNCNYSDEIISKVGIISADEVVYAGAIFGQNTVNLPYISNNTDFWTISPHPFTDGAFLWVNKKLSSHNWTSQEHGAARPVITLKPNATFTSNPDSSDEIGTINNPYKIIVD